MNRTYAALLTSVIGTTASGQVIDAGQSFAVALCQGSIYAWGNNTHGQLGYVGVPSYVAVQIVGDWDSVTAVACGESHVLALADDSTVWAWGWNGDGQLGNGETLDLATPIQIPGLDEVIQVAAGERYSAALKADGTVWTWGGNPYGVLGDGTLNVPHLTPQVVPGLDQVTAIASGTSSCYALRSDSTVWGWGHNHRGQLGIGTTQDEYSPIAISGLNEVATLASGTDHACAILSDSTLWTWGYNGYGQLGTGTLNDMHTPVQVDLAGLISVSFSTQHSIATRADGTMWAWGENNYGQLGLEATDDPVLTPTLIPNSFSSTTGTLATGRSFSLFLLADGGIWAWGYNGDGQLGTNSTDVPQVPEYVSFCISNVVPGLSSTSSCAPYPNPTSGLLWFHRYTPESIGVKVYDLHGSLLISTRIAGAHEALDVGFLPAGIYCYEVRGVNALHHGRLMKF